VSVSLFALNLAFSQIFLIFHHFKITFHICILSVNSLFVLGTGTGICTCMQSTGTWTGTWTFSTGTGTCNKVLVAKKNIFFCCWDAEGVASQNQKLRLWLIFRQTVHILVVCYTIKFKVTQASLSHAHKERMTMMTDCLLVPSPSKSK